MSWIDKIYQQSPWLIDPDGITSDVHLEELGRYRYIWRNEAFLSHAFADGVYVATGPRQVGKTTHLKLLIQKLMNRANHAHFFYFNCDALDAKREVIEVVEEYLRAVPDRSTRTFILLDEITSIKDGIIAVKYLVDRGFKRGMTYIVSGSSSVHLKKTGEFLPGRKGKGIDFHFLPLTFSEYVALVHPGSGFTAAAGPLPPRELGRLYAAVRTNRRFDVTKAFDAYLRSGGIPRVINEHLATGDISVGLYELYTSWIRSETAKHGRQERIVKIILERVLASLSSDLSYNAIVQDAGVGSHNTAYEYLAFLEDNFILAQLYHYDFSQQRVNYRKNKKIYFTDPFLFWLADRWVAAKPRQDYAALSDRQLKSRLVENAVAAHLSRLLPQGVWYHKSAQEIDFVSEATAWEVKYQTKIVREDVKGLLSFPGRRWVLSRDSFAVEKDYTVVPTDFFLLFAEKSLSN